MAAAWAFDSIFGNLRVDRRDRPATDHVVDDRRGHRALLDAGSAYVCLRQLHRHDYNGTATDVVLLVAAEPGPHVLAGVDADSRAVAVAGCNPDFNVWDVGTRTIWNPVPNLDIGLEVMYTKLEQNNDPGLVAFNFAGAGGRAVGLYPRRTRTSGPACPLAA